MHLTLNDLEPGIALLDMTLTAKLSVRDPDRFPFIHHLIQVIHDKNWRVGIVFAYLCERFPSLPVKNAIWSSRALGANGQITSDLLRSIPSDDKWKQLAAEALDEIRLPADPTHPLPIREAFLLAWLQERVPIELLESKAMLSDAVHQRPRTRASSHGVSWRRMFRNN